MQVFELLGGADILVGSMGSHVSRVLYNKMISSSRTSLLPPFISVDGYGEISCTHFLQYSLLPPFISVDGEISCTHYTQYTIPLLHFTSRNQYTLRSAAHAALVITREHGWHVSSGRWPLRQWYISDSQIGFIICTARQYTCRCTHSCCVCTNCTVLNCLN